MQSQRSEETSTQRTKLLEDLEKKSRNRSQVLAKRVQTCLEHDKHVAQVRPVDDLDIHVNDLSIVGASKRRIA
jgi:hypothetical protein